MSLEKTLRNLGLNEGLPLVPINGHISCKTLNKILIGEPKDFKINLDGVENKQNCLVVFDKKPEINSKITIKKVTCYTLYTHVE